MVKQAYDSSQHEKPTKKSEENITDIPRALQKDLEALAQQPDSALDYSDIPELEFDQLGKPIIGQFYRPLKKAISLRMDMDVLQWFQKHPKYQTLINKVCRMYYIEHKNDEK